MHFGADRCTALHPCPCASSSLRMKHPSQGHFIRCENLRCEWSQPAQTPLIARGPRLRAPSRSDDPAGWGSDSALQLRGMPRRNRPAARWLPWARPSPDGGQRVSASNRLTPSAQMSSAVELLPCRASGGSYTVGVLALIVPALT